MPTPHAAACLAPIMLACVVVAPPLDQQSKIVYALREGVMLLAGRTLLITQLVEPALKGAKISTKRGKADGHSRQKQFVPLFHAPK